MSSGSDTDEEDWFRPVWETEDDEADGDLDPPGLARGRWGSLRGRPDWRPVLLPLCQAQDAVARLEAALAVASAPVVEGLRARVAYREASGWLAQCGAWIHPLDLALREANLTGSVHAALVGGRLRQTLPATATWRAALQDVPDDQAIARGLTLARLWRRLAELRTWRPLADAAALRQALALLGASGLEEPALQAWLDVQRAQPDLPALIVAGQAAQAWRETGPGQEGEGRAGEAAAEGVFLAACLWREAGFGGPIGLPFWSAPPQRLHDLGLRIGADWLPAFLVCVAEAARQAQRQLHRLQRAEGAASALTRTARSKLEPVLEEVLRRPAVTARMLADRLDIAPQSALVLLKQLVAAGVLREATGRAAWRAYTVA